MLGRVRGQPDGGRRVSGGEKGALACFKHQAAGGGGQGNSAADNDHHGRAVLQHRDLGRRRGAGVRTLHGLQPLELELLKGWPEHFLPRARVLGCQRRDTKRPEIHCLEQFRNVHMLGRQAAAQDIVRCRHDLHAQAAQVRVHVAGGQIHRFAGLQGDPVEQERNQHAGIAGVKTVQLGERGELPGEPVLVGRNRHGGCRLHRLADRPAVVDQGPEHRLQPLRSGMSGGQFRDDPVQQFRDRAAGGSDRPADGPEEVGGLRGVAEAAQCLEGGQCQDHFRLGVLILVVALPRRAVHARLFFGCVSGPCLCRRRVDLEGKGRAGRQDLGQERQFTPEACARPGTEDGFRVRSDQLIKGPGPGHRRYQR